MIVNILLIILAGVERFLRGRGGFVNTRKSLVILRFLINILESINWQMCLKYQLFAEVERCAVPIQLVETQVICVTTVFPRFFRRCFCWKMKLVDIIAVSLFVDWLIG